MATRTHNLCFEQNKKNINIFPVNFFFHFLQPNIFCILHGRVFVINGLRGFKLRRYVIVMVIDGSLRKLAHAINRDFFSFKN